MPGQVIVAFHIFPCSRNGVIHRHVLSLLMSTIAMELSAQFNDLRLILLSCFTSIGLDGMQQHRSRWFQVMKGSQGPENILCQSKLPAVPVLCELFVELVETPATDYWGNELVS